MSTISRVLVGLLFVAGLVFFYSAARTLQTHQSWRQRADRLENDLKTTLEQNERLVDGDQQSPGIRELGVALHGIVVDRGRVWYGVTPGEIDDAGATSVTITAPVPHGITGNSILYVFQQSTLEPEERHGTYLGAFKVAGVTEADPKQDNQAGEVALVPVRPLPPEALERLKASAGPWALYEMLPRDRYDVFADVDEAGLEAILPASTVKEYLKQGKPAEATDPPERVDAEGNYVRQPRDYAVLFRELDRQMTLLRDRIASSESALASLNFVNEDSKQQKTFRDNEIAELTAAVKLARHELKAVQDYQQRLEKSLQRSLEVVQAGLDENEALQAELTRKQLAAAAAIDDRTQAQAEPPPY